jgi:hypothetical protein
VAAVSPVSLRATAATTVTASITIVIPTFRLLNNITLACHIEIAV